MQRARAVRFPPVVMFLILALVAVHGLRYLLTGDQDRAALLAFAFIPARYGDLAAQLPGGTAARLWSPITYAFLHADALHLVVNLVWMASFGSALARRFGAIRFLALSGTSAIAGAVLHYAVDPTDWVPVVGASAAVSGMMAGVARFAFAPGGMLAGGSSAVSQDVPAEPLLTVFTKSRAFAFILVWFAVNLLFGTVGGLLPGASGPIAWQAHIGGFLAGLLVFSLLDPVGHRRDTLANRSSRE